jgi:hypothetical protein
MGRHLYWSSILAAGAFVCLLVYPQLRSLTLSTDPAPAAARGFAAAQPKNPVTYGDLLSAAQARLATLPAGMLDRTDLTSGLGQKGPKGWGLLESPELKSAAELQARNMMVERFRSGVDNNGMGPGDRVAMLDRSGLYDGLDEQFAEVVGAANSSSGFAEMAKLFDQTSEADRAKTAAFNRFGMGCVQSRSDIICVRTLGKLSGHLAVPLPIARHRSDALDLQPKLDEAGISAAGWVLRDSLGSVLSSGQSFSRVQMPTNYRGPVRVGIATTGNHQIDELDGPAFAAQ